MISFGVRPPGVILHTFGHGGAMTWIMWAILWAILQPVAYSWVLMSQDGTLTFVAPVEIDAAWGQSRLTFKKDRVPKWDIYVDDANNLRISQLADNVHHLVFTPGPTGTLSVLGKLEMAGTMSLGGNINIGSVLPVQSFTHFGPATTISDYV